MLTWHIGDVRIDRIVEFQQHHLLDLLAELAEQGIEGLRLGKVAREAVEQPAAVVALQPAAHDRQHQLVAHQFTAGHHRLRFLTERSAGLDLGAQQVAGGEVEQAMGGR